MAFENVRRILGIGSLLSSWKLLLISASFSRPKYRLLFLGLLKPFIKDGQVSLRYRCFGRYVHSFVRLSDFSSDLISTREQCAEDVYHLDPDFHPDLVIDGGGNIGLFTLRAAAAVASSGQGTTKIVICEPLPRNIEQIEKHLKLNAVEAEILPACLGGANRSIPFYCRDAIDSSFDSQKPFTSVIEMPVYALREVINRYPAERILIKLDIEGMEVEALSTYIPEENRPVYIVGELHDFSVNATPMIKLFADHGWKFEFNSIADDHANFRACSPVAVPMIGWASAVTN